MGRDHVLDCYDVTVPQELTRVESLNFTNAIIVATVLYREGLRASNRTNQEKILSRYLRYLSSLKQAGKVCLEDVSAGIDSFEICYYGARSPVAELIAADLVAKEPVFRKTLSRGYLIAACPVA